MPETRLQKKNKKEAKEAADILLSINNKHNISSIIDNNNTNNKELLKYLKMELSYLKNMKHIEELIKIKEKIIYHYIEEYNNLKNDLDEMKIEYYNYCPKHKI